MTIPYRARVNERWFLNLPGFHGRAYVMAFVEDTSDCGPRPLPWCEEDCPRLPGELRAEDDPRNLGLRGTDQPLVRGRLEAPARQLAAQARHADHGPPRVPKGARGGVRRARPPRGGAEGAEGRVSRGAG